MTPSLGTSINDNVRVRMWFSKFFFGGGNIVEVGFFLLMEILKAEFSMKIPKNTLRI